MHTSAHMRCSACSLAQGCSAQNPHLLCPKPTPLRPCARPSPQAVVLQLGGSRWCAPLAVPVQVAQSLAAVAAAAINAGEGGGGGARAKRQRSRRRGSAGAQSAGAAAGEAGASGAESGAESGGSEYKTVLLRARNVADGTVHEVGILGGRGWRFTMWAAQGGGLGTSLALSVGSPSALRAVSACFVSAPG
eukprot:354874-Chlamydomonas_euryale.AAC.5